MGWNKGNRKPEAGISGALMALLLLVVFGCNMVYAQNGGLLQLSKTFKAGKIDSTILNSAAIEDSTDADAEVLYTKLIGSSRDEGIFGVHVYHDSIAAGSCTFTVEYRQFYSSAPEGKRWGAWKTVKSSAALNSRTLVQRDASNFTDFGSSNGVQLRITQSGTGGARHYPGVYIR